MCTDTRMQMYTHTHTECGKNSWQECNMQVLICQASRRNLHHGPKERHYKETEISKTSEFILHDTIPTLCMYVVVVTGLIGVHSMHG